MYFYLKRGLWTTEQQSRFFLLSPGKMLLTMFLFQKWLGSSFPEDVWAWWLYALTPASVHSLWSSPKCLNRLCLTVFSSLRSSLFLVHIFLPNFFLPVNFAFNMLWYSTPWTATPFSNDPLWLTLFVEGVFWTIAKSAVFPIIVVSKNKRYPEFILYGWSFIETQMWIWVSQIFWDTDFWLSLAVSFNHQN